MKDNGPDRPRTLFEALERHKEDNPNAYLICTECRQRHGGWCVDEFTTQLPPECPLALVATAIFGEHPGAPEPPENA